MSFRVTNHTAVLGLGFEFTTKNKRIAQFFDGRLGFRITQTYRTDWKGYNPWNS